MGLPEMVIKMQVKQGAIHVKQHGVDVRPGDQWVHWVLDSDAG
jgi:hypothetical protein